ncbi:MAG: hypothetical protein D3923_07745 [Candidatus Electrothrix sp. AR3]|nr:hypothetical protein [Candidatus Electrothrix sp. AR3]
MAFFDFLKNIKISGTSREKQLRAAAFQQDLAEELPYCEDLDSILINSDQPQSTEDTTEAKTQDEPQDQPAQEPTEVKAESNKRTNDPPVEEAQKTSPDAASVQTVADEQSTPLLPGGIYAVHDQEENTPYWIAKLVHTEDGLAHIIRYAERFQQLPTALPEKNLTVSVAPEDGSFGAVHLPLPEQLFAANSIYLRSGYLSAQDFQGYQIYVDSVFDCLHGDSPEWLRKAGSYAAWRNNSKAMAVLANRYLVGVDLPRDSKKALYWLNRIVQQGIDLLHIGQLVQEEEQVLTGGLYVRSEENGTYTLCKVVLKDKHGVQQLSWPTALEQLPQEDNPVQLLAEVIPSEKNCHAPVEIADFLDGKLFYFGLLPITLAEIHCYRTYLREVFADAKMQPSAFEHLLHQAEAGEGIAQHTLGQLYLEGDPAWEIKQNTAEAVRWFTEASNQGQGLSAYNLAEICRQGADCIKADSALAFEWLQYAAQLNCGLAQQQLAACYRHGSDCSPDLVLAHAWYGLTATCQNDLSEEEKRQAEKSRKAIETKLTPEQLEAALKHFRQLQNSF